MVEVHGFLVITVTMDQNISITNNKYLLISLSSRYGQPHHSISTLQVHGSSHSREYSREEENLTDLEIDIILTGIGE